MERQLLLVAVLISGLALSAGGCRSCSSCHDYDGPVADCGCGCGRTGSAFTGGCDGGCAPSGCESGNCGCGPSGGASNGEYIDGAPMMDGEYAE